MPHSPSRRITRHRAHGRRRYGWLRTLFKWLAISGLSFVILASIGVGFLYYKLSPELPDVQSLRNVQLQMPLRIYTADGDLIAEYGEKRREPVMISEVPQSLKNAIIASEDARFYIHPGVDWQGLARAGLHLLKTGKKGPGGSTITMQVARNFFLSNERTYLRKVREIFLSFKIEHELAKDEILELYLNKIYLGNRSYGFAAASRVYYGKKIGALNLAESAMLAGLPKAPSKYNPVVNPERALIRRNYVLRRLNDLDMIDDATYRQTAALPVTATLHYSRPEAEANYVGEMVRARVEQLFGDSWATAGYNVFTSIRSAAQNAANSALRDALYEYESRHGYRGPIATIDVDTLADAEALFKQLKSISNPGELQPAAVIDVDAEAATVITETGTEYPLTLEDVEWARERLNIDKRGDEITQVDEVLSTGDVIYLRINKDGSSTFVQEPGVEGAFVAMQPVTGEILALVGGFDFHRSKFNRVTQARRQPGSTFKPFIYSAALEAGDTAATIYNDAPVVFQDDALEDEWRPSNYSGRFFGPTRLREALVKSRNLVSIRVLREITVPFAIDYAERFGFAKRNMPPDLSLALGSATVTPMELTAAFSVFANGGYRVQPHFIQRIEDPRGKVLYSTPKVVLCEDCYTADDNPLVAEMEAEQVVGEASENDTATDAETADAGGEASGTEDAIPVVVTTDVVNAPRVIDARNAYIMSSMMREVVARGTGRRAGKALGRKDIGGKTGTTNNQLDAWFAGFNPKMVATAWVGSDGLDPLGRGEAGGIAALPMWTAFVARHLDGVAEDDTAEPAGIETIRIDKKTGEPSSGEESMMEIFMQDNMPEVDDDPATEQAVENGGAAVEATVKKTRQDKAEEVEQLF